jgi:hypothetical protein
MKVKFYYKDEFIEEMNKDRNELINCIDRSMVRVTRLFEKDKNLPFKHIQVLAGYSIHLGDGRTQIVELHQYCGQAMTLREDEEAVKKANELVDEISLLATNAGLQVRAGSLQE